MPILSRVTTPNTDRTNYTPGFVVNTVMVGNEVGVGRTLGILVVIKPPGGGWQEPRLPSYEDPYFGPLIPGEVSTITIRVPDEKSPITVDAVLASSNGEITVDALLSKYKYQYDHIKVYSIDEVDIL